MFFRYLPPLFSTGLLLLFSGLVLATGTQLGNQYVLEAALAGNELEYRSRDGDTLGYIAHTQPGATTALAPGLRSMVMMFSVLTAAAAALTAKTVVMYRDISIITRSC